MTSSDKPMTATVESVREALASGDIQHEAKPFLSETGTKVLQDAEKAAQTLSEYLHEGNKGEKLEEAIRHTQRAASAAASASPDTWKNLKTKSGEPLLTEEEANEAYENAKKGALNMLQCARLLVTKPEFRQLLRDVANRLVAVFEQELDISPEASTSEKAQKVAHVA